MSPATKRRKKSAPRKALTFDDIREMALSMPEVEETTSYGMSAFEAGGKRFAGLPVERPDVEPSSLGVMVTFEERERLIASRPDVYYVTDHYAPYPAVLVRFDKLRRDELRDILTTSWRLAMERRRPAPKSRTVRQRGSPR